MSAIRTEKRRMRKVLYISEGGTVVNVAKRWGIFLGDGRWPMTTYYTKEAAGDALYDIIRAGVIPSKGADIKIAYHTNVMDMDYNPLPGWHRVIDPQNPHWSIVGSKYQEHWLDKGWRQLEYEISQLPIVSFKSELQGGLVSQRRKPPLFHSEPIQGGSIEEAMATRLPWTEGNEPRYEYPIYQAKAQEMPCTYETEEMKAIREYIAEGHSIEEYISMITQQAEIQQRIDATEKEWWMRDAPELIIPRPVKYTILAHGQTLIEVLTTDDKTYEQVKAEVEAQIARLSPEDEQLRWHLERGSPETLAAWRASLTTKPSSPLGSPSVLVWVRKAGIRIKQVYHSFWEYLVRALNRHASENK